MRKSQFTEERTAALLLVAAALASLLACSAEPPSGTDGPEPRSGSGSPYAVDAPGASGERIVEAPTHVRAEACGKCHATALRSWRGSHHDLAMQVADEQTVLGDFDDTSYTYFGVTSTFLRRGGKYFVRTDGPDGELREYPIAYTFGVDPLQQYLIAFPGGRYQALNVCWDTRPAAEGGQRWFHLHPDAEISHDDVLHWTGPYQNWNYMCAECHSTNLEKNYRLAEDRYQTTWSEIDVSCEACHGPGSNHVQWARRAAEGDGAENDDPRMGLVVQLKDQDDATWVFEGLRATSRRSRPRDSRFEIETCGRCHARRVPAAADYLHGQPLADSHQVALLDEQLYHADGQIRDEVYVYGSFLQSKMYREGVTCGDCHDPHSLRLLRWGNALCGGCHMATKFDTREHHHHEPATAGASCVKCHMPSRLYMVVDERYDHSLRVPRPDLTAKIGTPNACNDCHRDRDAKWAVDAVVKWYGRARSEKPHYGEALHAGRRWLPGAERMLARVADDPEIPGIARASAVSLLGRAFGSGAARTVERALRDRDPLVRRAALGALEAVEPAVRLQAGFALLGDGIRTVRQEAARVLASVPRSLLPTSQRPVLERSLAEYRDAQLVNADRPDAHLNLGALHATLGEFDQARAAYETALRLAPYFAGAYVNLADLYRQQGRDDEGERILRRALEIAPESADVNYSLGLLLIRQQRRSEAIEALGRAAELDPERAQYAYAYGVGLHGAGDTERALAVLARAHQSHPGDRELLFALVTISRDSNALRQAIGYARKLLELSPEDPRAVALIADLEARGRGR